MPSAEWLQSATRSDPPEFIINMNQIEYKHPSTPTLRFSIDNILRGTYKSWNENINQTHNFPKHRDLESQRTERYDSFSGAEDSDGDIDVDSKSDVSFMDTHGSLYGSHHIKAEDHESLGKILNAFDNFQALQFSVGSYYW